MELGYATADRKRELYADADLVVLPYTSFASQSAVLQDAYAHQVPLVVSDVGALGETVREDRSGWVVEPGDAAMLAETLLGAIRDAEARTAAAAAMAQVAADAHPRAGRRAAARGLRDRDRASLSRSRPQSGGASPHRRARARQRWVCTSAIFGELAGPHPRGHLRAALQPREPAEVPELRLPLRRHLGPRQARRPRARRSRPRRRRTRPSRRTPPDPPRPGSGSSRRPGRAPDRGRAAAATGSGGVRAARAAPVTGWTNESGGHCIRAQTIAAFFVSAVRPCPRATRAVGTRRPSR